MQFALFALDLYFYFIANEGLEETYGCSMNRVFHRTCLEQKDELDNMKELRNQILASNALVIFNITVIEFFTQFLMALYSADSSLSTIS